MLKQRRENKVHGFRIEPGEIEAVLCQHPAVQEAAVVSHQEGGDSHLVASIVHQSGSQRDAPHDFQGYLGTRLPEAKVPRTFCFLSSLPRAASGKIDRRALCDPQWRSEKGETQ